MNDNWSASLFTFANDNYADDPGKEGADPSTRLGRYETKTWLTSAKLENRFDIAKGYLQTVSEHRQRQLAESAHQQIRSSGKPV